MKKAIGDADEAKALGPMMDQVRENFRKLGDEDVYKEAKLSAASTDMSWTRAFAKRIEMNRDRQKAGSRGKL